MLKVVAVGAKGRMCSMVIAKIEASKELELAAGIDVGDSLRDVIEGCDVVVDFSSPESSAENALICSGYKKPVVIGTTGLSPAEIKAIKGASKDIPIVFAPNMSIGVNVMIKLIKVATHILGDGYDINIVESHHQMKKDRPSGTANQMVDTVIDCLEKKREVVLYEEAMAKRKSGDDSIRVCSIREDDLIGEHDIEFRGHGESLKLTHHASTRKIFAKGAVKALSWVVKQPPGLYDMQDVLFSKQA